MSLKKRSLYLFLTILYLGMTGCATIPKESVTLSQEVGKGIVNNQRAYRNLFNRYFAQKRQQIDKVIMDKYLPNYIENIQEELRKEGEDPNSFSANMVKDIISDVIQKRDELQEDLEKTRVAIWERINKDHVLLLQANATITGLLQSAVNAKEATSSLGEAIQEATKSDFSFDEFEKLFDEHLKKAGDFLTEGISLYDTIRPIIEKKGE